MQAGVPLGGGGGLSPANEITLASAITLREIELRSHTATHLPIVRQVSRRPENIPGPVVDLRASDDLCCSVGRPCMI